MSGPLPPENSYGMRPEAVDFPMMLVLSFVYPCNAKCPHCPYSNSDIRQSYRDAPYMAPELFRKIADESGSHGAMLRISGGGEPMLHPQATPLLVHAKAAGCRVGLITNGSRFDEENSRALLQAQVDMIELSVDAHGPEEYAVMRKGLDWDTLLINTRRLLRLRRELGSASRIVASGVNRLGVDIARVEQFWMAEVGVDYFIQRKFLTWGENTTLDAATSADPTPYLDTESAPCPFIFERLNIDSRGNVMVCGYDIAGRTSMGNVNTSAIRDIWLGRDFQHYRALHLVNRGRELPLCAGCPDWQYRSWWHNYWKVMKNAEQNRLTALTTGETTADSGTA